MYYKGVRVGLRKQFGSVAKMQTKNDDGFNQVSNRDGKEGDRFKKLRRII